MATALDASEVSAPCCAATLSREPISAAEAERLATMMKALADPARLRLLSIVAASEGGEACVCDLIEPLGLSQPTVSHHLKVLTAAGFLSRSKRGTWAYFSLVPGSLERVAEVFAAGGRAGGGRRPPHG
ncbi:ArsR/SmtB family transcription factor [Microbacterium sp. zg.Y909]|uniref:ArsR/SmtB family transcription factor n=1 Tax=Microbacterium sp. zg.Y909 TaxID=2969413 RepID=UPI00214A9320|nr:metalloregulator ArsR/SmtB family transcription factor [Microbacterium sp. zg.Y909]MCR2826894.1 metalloregulator ArsR/SmtB family transcription factor [Microbacterium sp. zg.Y909]